MTTWTAETFQGLAVLNSFISFYWSWHELFTIHRTTVTQRPVHIQRKFLKSSSTNSCSSVCQITNEIFTASTGVPIIASLPHFYLAHREYRRGVAGLNPTKEKHEIISIFDPVSVSDRVCLSLARFVLATVNSSLVATRMEGGVIQSWQDAKVSVCP